MINTVVWRRKKNTLGEEELRVCNYRYSVGAVDVRGGACLHKNKKQTSSVDYYYNNYTVYSVPAGARKFGKTLYILLGLKTNVGEL